jgi:hypothetical protein
VFVVTKLEAFRGLSAFLRVFWSDRCFFLFSFFLDATGARFMYSFALFGCWENVGRESGWKILNIRVLEMKKTTNK